MECWLETVTKRARLWKLWFAVEMHQNSSKNTVVKNEVCISCVLIDLEMFTKWCHVEQILWVVSDSCQSSCKLTLKYDISEGRQTGHRLIKGLLAKGYYNYCRAKLSSFRFIGNSKFRIHDLEGNTKSRWWRPCENTAFLMFLSSSS